MTTKYQALQCWLTDFEGDQWKATFSDIEDILSFPLPQSARTYPAWWANQPHSQGHSWLNAGWKASALNLKTGTLTFIRSDHRGVGSGLTIPAAKMALAASMGISPKNIDITVRA